ncbi:hypothetical protein [Chryseobacterium arthrosphaerae]|nr:hypothetical protein [Chryseobacterium arthrosphaerae]
MYLQEIITESPKWTDVVSALSSAIGVPLVLWTLYKLMIKDKDRESEIKSLKTIATKLTDMQIEAEKRYKASKKPHIGIQLDYKENRIKLDFINSNSNVSIINFEQKNNDFTDVNIMSSTINDENGKQKFFIILDGKDKEIEYYVLHINYSTEEGYVFVQDILIWREKNVPVFAPSVIIAIENSVVL